MTRRLIDRIRPHVREEDLGKAASAMALALLTVLAAAVAGLQGQASLEAQRAGQIAEQIAFEAAGRDTTAVIQIGAAYGTYRRWYEELERAAWASYERLRATAPDEQQLLDTFQRAGNEISAWVQGQSPLLQPPYYDAATRVSDFAAYEADAMVGPSVGAAERRANELAVASAWGGKAAEYVTILTVIAVGLFFVGLSSTVRAGRRFLGVAGVSFGVAAAAWTIAVTAQPIHRLPDSAIEHYVAAQVRLAQAPDLGGGSPTDEVGLGPYDAALAEVDEALRQDPDYVMAYQLRAGIKVHYASELIISGVTATVDTGTLLRDGMADYRRYLESRPDDYAAWWNLGWAAYLVEDYRDSTAATSRALELAPTQFTLYLNRALAWIGLGDRAAATADVDRALALAAADTSDTANWYLGQSDLDIGRFAELRPAVADFLRETQLRLREAQVALRALGDPSPNADAPEFASVDVHPIEIGHYAGGRITEGAAMADGDHLATTDAVGIRVRATGQGIVGRNISARIWINGLPRPEFVTDVVADEATTVVDLVSPYGRAGFDLDPGDYELELYVDGSRRFEFDFVVDPPPSEPGISRTASEVVAELAANGFGCPAGESNGNGGETTCSWTNTVRSFWVLVRWDAADRITYVAVTASTTDPNDAIAEVGPLLFDYTVRLLYPSDLVGRIFAWIDAQGEAVNDFEIAGTTLRVFGASTTDRSLDITALWP